MKIKRLAFLFCLIALLAVTTAHAQTLTVSYGGLTLTIEKLDSNHFIRGHYNGINDPGTWYYNYSPLVRYLGDLVLDSDTYLERGGFQSPLSTGLHSKISNSGQYTGNGIVSTSGWYRVRYTQLQSTYTQVEAQTSYSVEADLDSNSTGSNVVAKIKIYDQSFNPIFEREVSRWSVGNSLDDNWQWINFNLNEFYYISHYAFTKTTSSSPGDIDNAVTNFTFHYMHGLTN